MPRRKKGRDLHKWKSNRPDASEGSVRIIGGIYRGVSLLYSGDKVTRPMKDSVREALFNLVGGYLENTVAIDLFAGTGVVGLEALSRGSKHAILVERHVPTTKVIRQNVETIKAVEQTTIVGSDTFFWARQFTKTQKQLLKKEQDNLERVTTGTNAPAINPPTPNQGAKLLQASELAKNQSPDEQMLRSSAWAIFCCPPYDLYVDQPEEVLTMLSSLMEICPPGSMIVVESDERFDQDHLPNAEQWSIRDYAPASIAVLKNINLEKLEIETLENDELENDLEITDSAEDQQNSISKK